MSAARRFAAGALAAACIMGAALRPAHADPALAAPPPPAKGAERWYGWQILLVDIAGLGAMTAGGIPLASKNSEAGAWSFYAGVLFTNFSGPVVHAFHWGGGADTEWKLPISYATRVFLPALGLLAGYGVGAKAAHCEPREGCTGGMIAGWIAGAYAATIIDAAAIAWEKAPAKPAARAPVLRAAPSFSPVNGGFVAGLSGSF